jgi:hypothetical protein
LNVACDETTKYEDERIRDRETPDADPLDMKITTAEKAIAAEFNAVGCTADEVPEAATAGRLPRDSRELHIMNTGDVDFPDDGNPVNQMVAPLWPCSAWYSQGAMGDSCQTIFLRFSSFIT